MDKMTITEGVFHSSGRFNDCAFADSVDTLITMTANNLACPDKTYITPTLSPEEKRMLCRHFVHNKRCVLTLSPNEFSLDGKITTYTEIKFTCSCS
jgi:hypothetical protein